MESNPKQSEHHVEGQSLSRILCLYTFGQTHDRSFVQLPLYYTGLDSTANVSFEGGKIAQYGVARDYSIEVNVSMKPMSVTWAIIT